MDDLEGIRQRRLQEIQARQAAAQDQAAQHAEAAQAAAQQEAAIQRLLQQVLESEARERLELIRMSRPQLAAQVTQQLVAAAQSGRLARRLTDADLRALLQSAPKDRDIRITRK